MDKSVKDSGRNWEAFGRMLSSLSTVFKDLLQNLGDVGSGFKLFVNVFDAVVKGFNAYAQAVRESKTAFEEWKKTTDGQAASLQGEDAAMSAFGKTFGGFIATLDKGIAIVSTAASIFSLIDQEVLSAETATRLQHITELWKQYGITMTQAATQAASGTSPGMLSNQAYIDYVMEMATVGLPYLTYSAWKAEQQLLALPTIIKDVGVSAGNAAAFWKLLNKTVDDYTKGVLTLKQAQDTLGPSFTAMIDAERLAGTEGSKAQTDFINKLRESGLQIKEVTDYINTQLGVQKESFISAADGLKLMAEAGLTAYDTLTLRIIILRFQKERLRLVTSIRCKLNLPISSREWEMTWLRLSR
jgi:hypothetical protein